MTKKTIEDLRDIAGKRILVRVDFNVPLDEKRNITDDTRIKAALPTIKYLIEAKAKIILVSHLGRPSGVDEKLRMDPIGARLSELLGKKVTKLDDCIGEEVENAISKAKNGDVILLENVRFYAEEEKNDEIFARKLASLADIYVNDAFGTAHRAHASTAGIAEFIPGVAGLLMEKEIKALSKLLENPEKPFLLILGGAKVSDKIGIIRNLLSKVDIVALGGGMAYAFLKAKNWPVGKSLLEEDMVPVAKEIVKKTYELHLYDFHTPLDHIVVTGKISPEAEKQVVERGAVSENMIGVDIGPQAIAEYEDCIHRAKTIFWNGPLGIFEIDQFATGTIAIAKAVAEAQAYTVVGGGDSIAALNKAGVDLNKISHISTGGGASLEFLEGKVLPGIACLQDK